MHNLIKGSPLPLGVTRTAGGVNFSVYAGNARVRLLLYKKETLTCAETPEPDGVIEAAQGNLCGGVWYVGVSGVDADKEVYQFEINGKRTPGSYAHALFGCGSFGEQRYPAELYGVIGSANAFDWGQDAPLRLPLCDVIAYSLHVRGFTKDKTSGVKHKGTFLGVAEKLSYLKKLGVNQIELMPAYEYPEVVTLDDAHAGTGAVRNYWGYGPAFYFAPKASFSAGGDPCTEMKQLVKSCHRAGIELIMEFYFPEGIGGSLIVDCLRYWAIAYHVDGFHVGGVLPMAQIENDPVLSACKIYALGFSEQTGGAADPYMALADPTLAAPKGQERLALYQDRFQQTCRRLLKSDEDQLSSFLSCMTAHPDGQAVINYIACHNGFTLHDLVSYDQKHNEENGEGNRDGSQYNYSWNCGEEGPTRKKKVLSLRRRQIKNALMMLYLSQGVPMLMAGDEGGNSQQGNNNAYCQDNAVSWVQWGRSGYDRIRTFVKKLIAIRKAHPVLHMASPVRYMDVYGCGFPDVSFHSDKAWYAQTDAYQRHIGVLFCDGKKQKNGKFAYDILYAAYNLHWCPHQFALPKLPEGMEWAVLLDTGGDEENNTADPAKAAPLADARMLTAPGRTVVLLVGREK